jgi:hypothetical protein
MNWRRLRNLAGLERLGIVTHHLPMSIASPFRLRTSAALGRARVLPENGWLARTSPASSGGSLDGARIANSGQD